MNFNSIEELSDEDIIELYNDNIIENNSISTDYGWWRINCSNYAYRYNCVWGNDGNLRYCAYNCGECQRWCENRCANSCVITSP